MSVKRLDAFHTQKALQQNQGHGVLQQVPQCKEPQQSQCVYRLAEFISRHKLYWTQFIIPYELLIEVLKWWMF
jgi:hypothetical protein